MDEATKAEILSLHAETLALQTLVVTLARKLLVAGVMIPNDIEAAFDEAIDQATALAMRFGPAASPAHTTKAISILEQLREAVVARK